MTYASCIITNLSGKDLPMYENQLPHLSPAASHDGASCVSAPSSAHARTRAIRIAQSLHASAKAKLACRKGQGTTEYAILVGVLVVIAIASGINGL